MAPVLEVSGLSTVFHTRTGIVRAVQDVSFSVEAGETLAIVGESGCGKTMTALSLMRLIPTPPQLVCPAGKKKTPRCLRLVSSAPDRHSSFRISGTPTTSGSLSGGRSYPDRAPIVTAGPFA